MRTNFCKGCGIEWLWGSLIVMCVFLQMASALEDQMTLEKRIFCNFDGCHNKRSGSSSYAAERLFRQLFPDKKRSPATDQDKDMAPVDESPVSGDAFIPPSWDDGMDAPLSRHDMVLDPAVVKAVIRKLLAMQRNRRAGF